MNKTGKRCGKRRNCSKAISPFATMFPTFSHYKVIHSIKGIFYFLSKYVQSSLLQNCRMRERVKLMKFAFASMYMYSKT